MCTSVHHSWYVCAVCTHWMTCSIGEEKVSYVSKTLIIKVTVIFAWMGKGNGYRWTPSYLFVKEKSASPTGRRGSFFSCSIDRLMRTNSSLSQTQRGHICLHEWNPTVTACWQVSETEIQASSFPKERKGHHLLVSIIQLGFSVWQPLRMVAINIAVIHLEFTKYKYIYPPPQKIIIIIIIFFNNKVMDIKNSWLIMKNGVTKIVIYLNNY